MRSHPTAQATARRALRALRALLIGLAACSAGAPEARAQISFVDLFRSASFTQTGNGNTLSSNGDFFAARLFSLNANDFSAVSLAYPGPGSPVALSMGSPTEFDFSSPLFANQAALDAAFPKGTYTFTASKGGPGTSTTASYTADDYPQSLPFLTGTDFSALQGMNPAAAFTFHFSPFVTGSNASASFLFLTVTDLTTNTLVVDDSFLSPATTSATVAANTFKAGDLYSYELIFSNRDIAGTTPPGASFPPQLGFDFRTTGAFVPVAVVPEPASLALLATAVAPGLLALRRGRLGRSAGRAE